MVQSKEMKNGSKMKKRLIQSFSMLLLVILVGCGEESKTIFKETDLNIIPKPLEMKFNQGAFRFTKDTKFVVASDMSMVCLLYTSDAADE